MRDAVVEGRLEPFYSTAAQEGISTLTSVSADASHKLQELIGSLCDSVGNRKDTEDANGLRCTPTVVTRSSVAGLLIHTSDAHISKLFVSEFTTREVKRAPWVYTLGVEIRAELERIRTHALSLRIAYVMPLTGSGLLHILDVAHNDLTCVLPAEEFTREFRPLVPPGGGAATTTMLETCKRIVSHCKLPSRYAQVGSLSKVFLHRSTLTALRAAHGRMVDILSVRLRRVGRGYLDRCALSAVSRLRTAMTRRRAEVPVWQQMDFMRSCDAVRDSEMRKGVLRDVGYDGQRMKEHDHENGKKWKEVAALVEKELAEALHGWGWGEEGMTSSKVRKPSSAVDAKDLLVRVGVATTSKPQSSSHKKKVTAAAITEQRRQRQEALERNAVLREEKSREAAALKRREGQWDRQKAGWVQWEHQLSSSAVAAPPPRAVQYE